MTNTYRCNNGHGIMEIEKDTYDTKDEYCPVCASIGINNCKLEQVYFSNNMKNRKEVKDE